MSVYKDLDSLYEQMEAELNYLKPAELQKIKKYMIFAFDRGERALLKRLEGK